MPPRLVPDQPNQLASIVQLEPIWVWFNLSERDVQKVRANLAEHGLNVPDLVNKVPIEVGLQTESGYPHKGVLDYADPNVNQSTGTMQVRGIFENTDRSLLPGYFVRVRVPMRAQPALLVPAVFVQLERMPSTPNGKVDRLALLTSDPVAPASERVIVAPRTPGEKTLAALWQQVLGVEQMSIYDNFFELGGDSLLATSGNATAGANHC